MPKRVNQDGSGDVVANSAYNQYGEGVTQAEVETLYDSLEEPPTDPEPISYGLNARVVKGNGKKSKKSIITSMAFMACHW